jgi:NADPH:quinone reductase-like Zn-dependent oxidoreductase
VGTCGPNRFDDVRRFEGEPVTYGPGLEERARAAAPEGYAAALDCVGTDEAVDVSLVLVPDRRRVVTIAAKQRGAELGIRVIGGDLPESAAYRDGVRAELLGLAADGRLVVPMAGIFPLERALEAAELVATRHPGGKVALVPTTGST